MKYIYGPFLEENKIAANIRNVKYIQLLFLVMFVEMLL